MTTLMNKVLTFAIAVVATFAADAQILPGYAGRTSSTSDSSTTPTVTPMTAGPGTLKEMISRDNSTQSVDTTHIPAVFREPGTEIVTRPEVAGTMSVDSLLDLYAYRRYKPIPRYMLRPAVFDTYYFLDSLSLKPADHGEIVPWVFEWLDDDEFNTALVRRARQNFMINYPQYVRYNERLLPEPPKKFRAEVDPMLAKIVISEVPVEEQKLRAEVTTNIRRRNWLHDFNGSLQFSQAYVSPNWYQGGTNNLNMLLGLNFVIKLNPAFYPNLLFENTFSYKLGLNSATDDELRNYSISEDLFQINSKLGYKAARRWYYSLAAVFKTQILNNYKKNTNTLSAAFFSPGELNLGVGMTYNYANAPSTFTLDASISPLSYNLKTCFHSDMDVTSFGIKVGRHTVSDFGSSGEVKVLWKLAHNIRWQSRFFLFTNYHYAQGDWENTIQFNINRFLSTQIYVHLRYDSGKGAEITEGKWRDWQLKEILSFGFSYFFSSYK